MLELKNKVVIVTGGSSGIGKAIAKAFSHYGAIVVIADIDKSGSDIIEEFNRHENKGKFIYADVSTSQGASHVIQETEKLYGKIDILVNNAGIEISGPVTTFKEEDFDRLIAVNLKSVFLCSKYVLIGMINRNVGTIINLASVASFMAWPDDAVYCASKAGVLLLTKSMAVEYAPYKIRVNAVAPGIIDTPMIDRAVANRSNIELAKKEKGELHPMGRIGKPEEVAEAVLFLSSDAASFITGATLPIDGGYLAG